MSKPDSEFRCLNCNRSEKVTPLVALHYAGSPAWICSQCLPTLIHQPQQLAGKIANAEQIKPAPPHKH